MASTTTGLALTIRQAAAQRALRARFLRALLPAWALLDVGDLDGSYPGWVFSVAEVFRTHQDEAAKSAAAYFAQFRAAETGRAGNIPPPRPPTSLAELRRRLHYGAVAVPKLHIRQGQDPALAMRYGLAMVSGQGGQLVGDAARGTVCDAADADELAYGYRRTTSGSSCHFCALLASRGAVFSEQTVTFRSHRGCGCGSEPVFSRNYWLHTPPDKGLDTATRLWRETPGANNADKLKNFRRRYHEAMDT